MTVRNRFPAWNSSTPPRLTAARVVRPSGADVGVSGRKQIVLPYRREPAAAGWRCVVLALDTLPPAPPQVTVPDDELAAGRAVPIGFPVGEGDGDAYAAIWQACARLRFPSGHARHVIDALAAVPVRQPGSLRVELDPPAMRRVIAAVRLRRPQVERLLARIEAAGLLTACQPAQVAWPVYALTMPQHPMPVEPTTEPGTP
jgi:hypothetical protein